MIRLITIAVLTLAALFPALAHAQTGDVDCSGRTDSMDALIVIQRLAGFIIEPGCYSEADIDDNGTVDAVDALLILQFDAGLWDGAR